MAPPPLSFAERSPSPRAALAERRVLRAELDRKFLLDDKVDVRAEEIVDDPRKVGTRQSPVIGAPPPRIIAAAAVIIMEGLWSKIRNHVTDGLLEAAVDLLFIPQRSLSQPDVSAGAPLFFSNPAETTVAEQVYYGSRGLMFIDDLCRADDE
jgi:hypothetical protein